jgi:hypothetical protein
MASASDKCSAHERIATSQISSKFLVCFQRAARLRFPRLRPLLQIHPNREFDHALSGVPQAAHEDTYSPFGPDWKSRLDLYNGSYNLLHLRRNDEEPPETSLLALLDGFRSPHYFTGGQSVIHYSFGGSHNSIRFPSGSMIHANRP